MYAVAGIALASFPGGEHLNLNVQPGACCRGRGMFQANQKFENMMVKTLPSKRKTRYASHYEPFPASALYIGGGSLVFILVIVVVVLLLRG